MSENLTNKIKNLLLNEFKKAFGDKQRLNEYSLHLTLEK